MGNEKRASTGQSIGGFLSRSFVGLFLLLSVGMVVNLWALHQMRERHRQVAASALELTLGRYRLLTAMTDQDTGLRSFLLTGSERGLDPMVRGRDAFTAELQRLDTLGPRIVTPDVREQVERQRIAAQRWMLEAADPLVQARRESAAAANDLAGRLPLAELFEEFRAVNQAFATWIAERRRREAAETDRDAQLLVGAVVALSLLLIVGWAVVLWQLKRRVRRPLATLVAAAEAVRAGKRSIAIDLPYCDEFAVMAASLEAMVSAIRRQEAELNSEMRHRDTILEHMAEGLAVAEPDGRIVLLNPAAIYLLGVDEAPDPHEAAAAVLSRLVACDPHDEPEIGQARVSELGDRSLSIISSPVPAGEGLDLGIVHVIRDVTDLERIDRMKSEFIALVSHELRTPLTSIRGFTELILDGDAGPVSDEVASYLTTVRANTDRLVSLVNDLLDISRIEAGRVTLKMERLELGGLLREAAGMIQPQLSSRRQRLDLRLPGFLPRLYADRDRLIQVVTNLLSNAHKYSPDESAISLSAEWRDGAVRLSVTDQGIGISPENQRRLFTKFFRADEGEVRKVHGTGLGLAISRALVEMHGGHIEVQSRPGGGSTFTVVLPVVFRVDARPSDEPTTRVPSQRVLVVDGDVAAAALVRRYLEQAGYGAQVAATVQEAVDAIRSGPVDAVVLDLLLPRLAGFEVIDRVREQPGGASMPIILASIRGDQALGVRLGVVDVLAKPLSEPHLRLAARGALDDATSRKVLVVGADAATRALVSITLRDDGCEPLPVADLLRGAELARSWGPDAIVLDLSVPGPRGEEVVERLQSDPATRDVPLIVFSPGDRRSLHDLYPLSRADLKTGAEPLDGLIAHVRQALGSAAVAGERR